MDIITKAKELINKMNAIGIPIPLIRLDGKPTFTGTLVLLSFCTALLGQLGKVTKLLGNVDLVEAHYLFGISLSAYLGRRYMTGKSGEATLSGSSDDDKTA